MGYGTFWGIHRLTRGRLGIGDIWFSGFIDITFGFWGWNWSILLVAFRGIGYLSIRKIIGSVRDIRNTDMSDRPVKGNSNTFVPTLRTASQEEEDGVRDD